MIATTKAVNTFLVLGLSLFGVGLGVGVAADGTLAQGQTTEVPVAQLLALAARILEILALAALALAGYAIKRLYENLRDGVAGNRKELTDFRSEVGEKLSAVREEVGELRGEVNALERFFRPDDDRPPSRASSLPSRETASEPRGSDL